MPRRSRPRAPLGDDVLAMVAARFRALGDPSRLRILDTLIQGEHAVGEIEEATGLAQANVSRHLGILRREGLVERRAEGNRGVYRIADPSLKQLCDLVCGSLAGRLAGDLEAIAGAGV